MQTTTLSGRTTLSLAICLLALTACVYEMPIQQGNFLDATALVQVKKGMTRAQVRYLLGTPMVPGGFDNDRWDYHYYLKLTQLKSPRRARAAVYFHNDLVDRVDSDVMPVASDLASNAPSATPEATPTPEPPSALPPAPPSATTDEPTAAPPNVSIGVAPVVPAAPPATAPAGVSSNPPGT